MKDTNTGLLFLTCTGMELSWIYAWATFITRSLLHWPFPLLDAIAAFLFSAMLYLFIRNMGFRIITILGMNIAGFTVVALRILYLFNYPSEPFLSANWIFDAFTKSREPIAWLSLTPVIFFSILFWVGGAALAKRSKSYLSICSRFDLGLSAFFSLILIKLILRVRCGVVLPDPIFEPFLFPFFVFALLSVGLARNQSNGSRNYLSGYQGIGLIFGFTGIIILIGTGSALLFLPYLKTAADTGYTLIKIAAEPVGQLLVGIIRVIFFGRSFRSDNAGGSSVDPYLDLMRFAEADQETPFWASFLIWAAVGVAGLGLLFLLGLCLWFVFDWLLSKTKAHAEQDRLSNLILHCYLALRFILIKWWEKLRLRGRRVNKAAHAFTVLLNWGKSSGVPIFRNETPKEYGFRLTTRFPSVNREIGLIVDLFNQEAYGEIPLDAEQRMESQRALYMLSSPVYWPARLRSWMLRQKDNGDD